jgi:hypothetical protein
MLEREAEDMAAVERLILDSAAFVMENDELSGSGFFAFVTEGEFSFTYFITAAHVVWNDWRKRNAKFPPAGEVIIRLNRRRGGTMDIGLKKSEWIFHDDRRFVDLCAVYLSEPKHKYLSEGDVGVINIESLAVSVESVRIQSMEMMLGDEIFITGAFWPRLGEKKNIPIVRTGNIAALCEEPIDFFSPRQAAYLVETRSIGGISGSPVWFDPNTRHGRFGHSWGPVVTTNPNRR